MIGPYATRWRGVAPQRAFELGRLVLKVLGERLARDAPRAQFCYCGCAPIKSSAYAKPLYLFQTAHKPSNRRNTTKKRLK